MIGTSVKKELNATYFINLLDRHINYFMYPTWHTKHRINYKDKHMVSKIFFSRPNLKDLLVFPKSFGIKFQIFGTKYSKDLKP